MSDSEMDLLDPDAALMVAFQNGSEEAFALLLDKYQRPIVNFLYRIVNDRSEGEDLAQEVFLRVYRARAKYEPRGRFAPWIYRIATNVGLKAARRKRRTQLWSVSSKEFEPQAAAVCESAASAEQQLVQAELTRVVRRSIERLPVKERIAIVLRRYEELSYREIADVMNCTEAAVKTYIHRGKLHLRDRILSYVRGGKI